MGKKSAPAAPDYSQVAAANQKAAEYSYELGKQQFDWAKSVYEENKGRAQGVMDAMLKGMQQNYDIAQETYSRYKEKFQPVEDELIKGAQEAGTEEKLAQRSGAAQAMVAQNFEQARNAAQANLEKFGVNESDVRGRALDFQSRIAEGAARAAAGTGARDKEEMLAIARKTDVANLGKGYPGQVQAAYQTAAQQGTGSQNVALATTASGAQTMGTPTQWQALGNQSTGQWGNTLNQQFQNQMASWEGTQKASSGAGSALGFAASFLPMLLAEEGGPIPDMPQTKQAIPAPPGMHDGVNVTPEMSPSRGGAPDDVNAQLTAGEFIIPADVAAFKGEEFFQKLIQNARKQKMNAPAQPSSGPAQPGPPKINTQAIPSIA